MLSANALPPCTRPVAVCTTCARACPSQGVEPASFFLARIQCNNCEQFTQCSCVHIASRRDHAPRPGSFRKFGPRQLPAKSLCKTIPGTCGLAPLFPCELSSGCCLGPTSGRSDVPPSSTLRTRVIEMRLPWHHSRLSIVVVCTGRGPTRVGPVVVGFKEYSIEIAWAARSVQIGV